MKQKVIGVAGFKNSGKTTLVERLVREFTAREYRISTVKHAHHAFDIDHEGRDSFRHRKAGATEVAVVSRNRWAIMHELKGADEPGLDLILGKIASCDLVIVEGYKHDTHDKIELRDLNLDHPKLAGTDASIIAIAANGRVDGERVPVFNRDDIKAIADFIVLQAELNKP